jgi:hypothetical protein
VASSLPLPWLGLWVVSGATQSPSSLLGFPLQQGHLLQHQPLCHPGLLHATLPLWQLGLVQAPLLGIACFSGGWLGLCLSFDCCLHCLPGGWLFPCGLVSHGPASLLSLEHQKLQEKTMTQKFKFQLLKVQILNFPI